MAAVPAACGSSFSLFSSAAAAAETVVPVAAITTAVGADAADF